MQTVFDDDFLTEPRTLSLPDADEDVIPGVKWGFFYDFFTPAFWASRMWLCKNLNDSPYKLGSTLTEEVAACLLGGYGMKAETALAAFCRVKDRGFLKEDRLPSQTELLDALKEPLMIGGKSVRYRYPYQKSRYLQMALRKLQNERPPLGNHQIFRDWLMTFQGVGPKTASWITRNWLSSDQVAIIDIHVYRAGLLCGMFEKTSDIAGDYFDLEKKFLLFAKALGGNAAILDMVIWNCMKELNHMALRMLDQKQFLQH